MKQKSELTKLCLNALLKFLELIEHTTTYRYGKARKVLIVFA